MVEEQRCALILRLGLMKENKMLLEMQKGEITEHHVYSNLAKIIKNGQNRKILLGMAGDELKHYSILKKITNAELKPDMLKIYWYTLISGVFGLSFGLKLMENSETNAQKNYSMLKRDYAGISGIIRDEERHEMELINIIKDERLDYASAVVLGLNDAIVEFTGTIAGLTFAFGDGRIIGMIGMILGVAASLSMGASSYMSSREEGGKNPLKSFFYTGGTYMLTVLLMIAPYFVFSDVYLALAVLLALTVAIIAAYSFYISVAKDLKFWPKFIEMVAVSFGVAIVSFLIGTVLRAHFGLVQREN